MSKKTDNPLIEFKLYSPLKIHTDIIENLTQKPAGELFKFISSMADKENIYFIKEIVYNPEDEVIIVSLKAGSGDIDTIVYWNSEEGCWDLDEDGQKTGSDALTYYCLEKY